MKNLLLIAFVALALAGSTTSALACACCADRGTYSVWTGAVADYQNELLKDMKFGKKAEFFMTEADWEPGSGLGELQKEWESEVYEAPDLVDAYLNNTWRLTFRSRGGKTGSLSLPRSAKFTVRRVDLQDGPADGSMVSLYKEFIFNGGLRGTGFFKSGIIGPTSYTLIFQGRGNNCDNAEDFTSWRLEVKGRKANFAFFGKMAVAEKDVTLDTAQ